MKKHFIILAFCFCTNFSFASSPCNAIWIGILQDTCFHGTTTGSLPSGIQTAPCSFADTPDNWYYFLAPSCSDSLTVELYGGSALPRLTFGILYLYSGSCTSLSGFNCRTCTPTDTMVDLTLISPAPSDTIFIRIKTYAGGNYGDFDICIHNYCTLASANGVTTITKSFDLIPNPASNKVLIKSMTIHGPAMIEINDSFGRAVLSTPLPDNKSLELDVAPLAAGTYYVKVISEDGVAVKKLLLLR